MTEHTVPSVLGDHGRDRHTSPAYEVMYLLDAAAERHSGTLRTMLEPLG